MIINVIGKPCPIPVIEAKKALKSANENEIVEVWVDNEIAVQNLRKLAKHMGLQVLDEKVAQGEYHVRIAVGNQMASTGKVENEETIERQPEETTEKDNIETEAFVCEDCQGSGSVVVISSDCMGNGDDVLGKLLMKGFLFALTQQDVLPQTIVLYNGGAKWSCEGSDALEDLKSMQEQGVEILTCGTCLNHYGLSEKLAVGSVTNMYEIVEKMMGAKKLVRP